uniref:DUF4220 domain-containing protein n=1 Tax=Oryza punctata TaxID=4537 RepID=A0A0E0LGD7_ORYPU
MPRLKAAAADSSGDRWQMVGAGVGQRCKRQIAPAIGGKCCNPQRESRTSTVCRDGIGDGRVLLSNTTLTDLNSTLFTLSYRARDFWKSPRVTVIRIEVLVVLAACMLLFLAVFGFLRRRCTNPLFQKAVMGFYVLSSSLVTYTLGSMQSSAVKGGMYPIWALSLFILFGCADSITAYSLHDNNQMWRQIYIAYLYFFYVALIAVTIITQGSGSLPLLLLTLVAAYKFSHRTVASLLASMSWNLNKMVADYMHEEHTIHPIRDDEYEEASMKGYRYLVDWPLDKSKLEAGTSYATRTTEDAQIICIDEIWLHKDKPLSTDLKDACLSFSLFHLLRRRFFGFTCAESALPKTRDFIFKGLLQLNDDKGAVDYIRAFKVIEVELAFMHDFFFTKYALIYYGSSPAAVWSLVSAALIAITAYLTASHHWLQGGPTVVSNTTADVVITMLMLASIGMLELLQPLLYWTTIWGRVSFVCQYIRQQQQPLHGRFGCCMRFKELLAKIGSRVSSNRSYWQDRLGQYSLLESTSCNNPPEASILVIGRLLYKYTFLVDSRAFAHRNRLDPASSCKKKPGKPINLSPELKEAIYKSLQQHAADGNLTNGESSLASNGAHHLFWACVQRLDVHPTAGFSQKTENQTCSILTWHIATCYCEMETPQYQQGTDELKNVQVARALSRYCAYLVVAAPKLLPGHHYDTMCLLDVVGEEAVQFLHGNDEKDKYQALRGYVPPPEGQPTKSIFESGLKLGKQLEALRPEEKRWKVLADFWSEMLLYISPSDNVKEHIEQLTKGGEFITHLWALLSHAGILERPRQEHDPGSV